MKMYVSWNMVDEFIDIIKMKYKDHKFTGVYGLPRGGLIFAVILSHRLGVPMLMAPVKGCLIVDDICDSGESLLHYRKNSSGEDIEGWYTIVTMFYKENKLGIVPDYYMIEKKNDWIVFPWEERS